MNKREWINNLSLETAQVAREKEEWRHELKKGDYVDVINFFATPENLTTKLMGGWSPAKIVFVDKVNILVSFLRCSKNTQRKISRFSPEVA
jgi:hypothetical protein